MKIGKDVDKSIVCGFFGPPCTVFGRVHQNAAPGTKSAVYD